VYNSHIYCAVAYCVHPQNLALLRSRTYCAGIRPPITSGGKPSNNHRLAFNNQPQPRTTLLCPVHFKSTQANPKLFFLSNELAFLKYLPFSRHADFCARSTAPVSRTVVVSRRVYPPQGLTDALKARLANPFLACKPFIAVTVSDLQDSRNGPSVSAGLPLGLVDGEDDNDETIGSGRPLPPPQYPASEASCSRPPPSSSLYASSDPADGNEADAHSREASEAASSTSYAAPAYATVAFATHGPSPHSSAFYDPVGETKRALPQDTKGESSRKEDDTEPPPAYSEGPSPLHTFTYLMATAGGASSIITQVQQGGPGPVNAIGGTQQDVPRIRTGKFLTFDSQMLAPMSLS
jgi:hypothetical protein